MTLTRRRMPKGFQAILATMALLMAGVAWIVWSQSRSGDAASAERVARGAEVYTAECASCHGVNLEGAPNWRTPNADGTLPAPPHDDSGHTWHHPDTMLFAYTKNGGAETLKAMGVTGFASAMPGFGDRLSNDQIQDVLIFIKSRWSRKARAHQARITDQDRGS